MNPLIIALVCALVVSIVATGLRVSYLLRRLPVPKAAERDIVEQAFDDVTMIIPAVRPSGPLPVPSFDRPQQVLHNPRDYAMPQACVGGCPDPEIKPGQAVWRVPNREGGHYLICLDCTNVVAR